MSKEVKYSRIILKRTNIPDESATTASHTDHTVLPQWRTTDVYVGEMFLNVTDPKMYVRTDVGIKEIPLIDAGDFSLNVFSDVEITSPTNGQVLTFTGGTWKNRNPQFEGTGITYTTVMSPMTMSAPIPTTTTLTQPQILRLVDISDVAESNLSNDDVLIYRNNKWVNINANNLPIKKPKLNELENVTITDVEDNQFLVYSGDKWTNKTKLDKITSLAWDKEESKLIVETEQGTFNLSIQGKPIHTIIEDVELDNSFHTLIIDASVQDISILLPPAQLSYGDIFIFKIINYTFDTTIYAADSEVIHIESPVTEYIINEGSTEKKITLQSDGISTWYSI